MKTRAITSASKKIIVLLFMMIISFSCQKNEDPLPTTRLNASDITIEEAKLWLSKSDSSYTPLWNSAIFLILSPKKPPVLIVPILQIPKKKIEIVLNGLRSSYEPSSVSQDLLFTKVDGVVQVQILKVIPKLGTYWNKSSFKLENFSGMILLNDVLEDRPSNSWVYEKGNFIKNMYVNDTKTPAKSEVTIDALSGPPKQPIPIYEPLVFDEPLGGGGGSGGSGNPPGLVWNNISLFSNASTVGCLVMSNEDQMKYPRFRAVVANLKSLVENDEVILFSLITWTGLSKADILNHLTFGQGPLIIIKDIVNQFGNTKVYGSFNKTTPNQLNISKSFVLGLEGAKLGTTQEATAFLLAVTVLHEYVHYGDFQTGDLTPPGVEEGTQFEKQAFGIVVSKQNAYSVYINLYGKQK